MPEYLEFSLANAIMILCLIIERDMQGHATGISLSSRLGSEQPACPFQAPYVLEWPGPKLYGEATSFSLKEGLDYLNLKWRFDGPEQWQIDLGSEHLLMGYVSRGWAKLQPHPGSVEKIESGQWFQFTSHEIWVDRTAPDGVHIDLYICSQGLARRLIELDPSMEQPRLKRFATWGRR